MANSDPSGPRRTGIDYSGVAASSISGPSPIDYASVQAEVAPIKTSAVDYSFVAASPVMEPVQEIDYGNVAATPILATGSVQDSFSLRFPNWVGPRPTRDFSLSDKGKKYLDLVNQNQQGRQGFLEGISSFTQEDIPIVGDVMAGIDMVKLPATASRLQKGEPVSEDDALDLNLYLERMAREEDATWLGGLGRGLKDLVLFGAEFGALALLTAGMGGLWKLGTKATTTAGRAAAKTAVKQLVKAPMKNLVPALVKGGANFWDDLSVLGLKSAGLVNKVLPKGAAKFLAPVAKYTVPPIVGGAAMTATDQAIKKIASVVAGAEDAITSGAVRRDVSHVMSGEEPDADRAFWLDLGDRYVEYMSETTGVGIAAALSKAGLGVIAGKRIGDAIVKRWAPKGVAKAYESASTGIKKGAVAAGAYMGRLMEKFKLTPDAALGMAKTMGYNGWVEEMGEERIGGFVRGLFGIDSDEKGGWGLRNAFDQMIPHMDQLTQEMVLFSLPLGVANGIGALQSVGREGGAMGYFERVGKLHRFLKESKEPLTPTQTTADGKTVPSKEAVTWDEMFEILEDESKLSASNRSFGQILGGIVQSLVTANLGYVFMGNNIQAGLAAAGIADPLVDMYAKAKQATIDDIKLNNPVLAANAEQLETAGKKAAQEAMRPLIEAYRKSLFIQGDEATVREAKDALVGLEVGGRSSYRPGVGEISEIKKDASDALRREIGKLRLVFKVTQAQHERNRETGQYDTLDENDLRRAANPVTAEDYATRNRVLGQVGVFNPAIKKELAEFSKLMNQILGLQDQVKARGSKFYYSTMVDIRDTLENLNKVAGTSYTPEAYEKLTRQKGERVFNPATKKYDTYFTISQPAFNRRIDEKGAIETHYLLTGLDFRAYAEDALETVVRRAPEEFEAAQANMASFLDREGLGPKLTGKIDGLSKNSGLRMEVVFKLWLHQRGRYDVDTGHRETWEPYYEQFNDFLKGLKENPGKQAEFDQLMVALDEILARQDNMGPNVLALVRNPWLDRHEKNVEGTDQEAAAPAKAEKPAAEKPAAEKPAAEKPPAEEMTPDPELEALYKQMEEEDRKRAAEKPAEKPPVEEMTPEIATEKWVRPDPTKKPVIDAASPEGVGFLEGIEGQDQIRREFGENIQAHGISKGSPAAQVRQLRNIIENGFDKNKTLHVAQLTKGEGEAQGTSQTGGGTASTSGMFVLAGRPGSTVESGDFVVLVNQVVPDSVFKSLKSAFPSQVFARLGEESEAALTNDAAWLARNGYVLEGGSYVFRGGAKATVPAQPSAEKNVEGTDQEALAPVKAEKPGEKPGEKPAEKPAPGSGTMKPITDSGAQVKQGLPVDRKQVKGILGDTSSALAAAVVEDAFLAILGKRSMALGLPPDDPKLQRIAAKAVLDSFGVVVPEGADALKVLRRDIQSLWALEKVAVQDAQEAKESGFDQGRMDAVLSAAEESKTDADGADGADVDNMDESQEGGPDGESASVSKEDRDVQGGEDLLNLIPGAGLAIKLLRGLTDIPENGLMAALAHLVAQDSQTGSGGLRLPDSTMIFEEAGKHWTNNVEAFDVWVRTPATEFGQLNFVVDNLKLMLQVIGFDRMGEYGIKSLLRSTTNTQAIKIVVDPREAGAVTAKTVNLGAMADLWKQDIESAFTKTVVKPAAGARQFEQDFKAINGQQTEDGYLTDEGRRNFLTFLEKYFGLSPVLMDDLGGKKVASTLVDGAKRKTPTDAENALTFWFNAIRYNLFSGRKVPAEHFLEQVIFSTAPGSTALTPFSSLVVSLNLSENFAGRMPLTRSGESKATIGGISHWMLTARQMGIRVIQIAGIQGANDRDDNEMSPDEWFTTRADKTEQPIGILKQMYEFPERFPGVLSGNEMAIMPINDKSFKAIAIVPKPLDANGAALPFEEAFGRASKALELAVVGDMPAKDYAKRFGLTMARGIPPAIGGGNLPPQLLAVTVSLPDSDGWAGLVDYPLAGLGMHDRWKNALEWTPDERNRPVVKMTTVRKDGMDKPAYWFTDDRLSAGVLAQSQIARVRKALDAYNKAHPGQEIAVVHDSGAHKRSDDGLPILSLADLEGKDAAAKIAAASYKIDTDAFRVMAKVDSEDGFDQVRVSSQARMSSMDPKLDQQLAAGADALVRAFPKLLDVSGNSRATAIRRWHAAGVGAFFAPIFNSEFASRVSRLIKLTSWTGVGSDRVELPAQRIPLKMGEINGKPVTLDMIEDYSEPQLCSDGKWRVGCATCADAAYDRRVRFGVLLKGFQSRQEAFAAIKTWRQGTKSEVLGDCLRDSQKWVESLDPKLSGLLNYSSDRLDDLFDGDGRLMEEDFRDVMQDGKWVGMVMRGTPGFAIRIPWTREESQTRVRLMVPAPGVILHPKVTKRAGADHDADKRKMYYLLRNLRTGLLDRDAEAFDPAKAVEPWVALVDLLVTLPASFTEDQFIKAYQGDQRSQTSMGAQGSLRSLVSLGAVVTEDRKTYRLSDEALADGLSNDSRQIAAVMAFRKFKQKLTNQMLFNWTREYSGAFESEDAAARFTDDVLKTSINVEMLDDTLVELSDDNRKYLGVTGSGAVPLRQVFSGLAEQYFYVPEGRAAIARVIEASKKARGTIARLLSLYNHAFRKVGVDVNLETFRRLAPKGIPDAQGRPLITFRTGPILPGTEKDRMLRELFSALVNIVIDDIKQPRAEFLMVSGDSVPLVAGLALVSDDVDAKVFMGKVARLRGTPFVQRLEEYFRLRNMSNAQRLSPGYARQNKENFFARPYLYARYATNTQTRFDFETMQEIKIPQAPKIEPGIVALWTNTLRAVNDLVQELYSAGRYLNADNARAPRDLEMVDKLSRDQFKFTNNLYTYLTVDQAKAAPYMVAPDTILAAINSQILDDQKLAVRTPVMRTVAGLVDKNDAKKGKSPSESLRGKRVRAQDHAVMAEAVGVFGAADRNLLNNAQNILGAGAEPQQILAGVVRRLVTVAGMQANFEVREKKAEGINKAVLSLALDNERISKGYSRDAGTGESRETFGFRGQVRSLLSQTDRTYGEIAAIQDAMDEIDSLVEGYLARNGGVLFPKGADVYVGRQAPQDILFPAGNKATDWLMLYGFSRYGVGAGVASGNIVPLFSPAMAKRADEWQQRLAGYWNRGVVREGSLESMAAYLEYANKDNLYVPGLGEYGEQTEDTDRDQAPVGPGVPGPVVPVREPGATIMVRAPAKIPGVIDSGPGTPKGTGADQMMRDKTVAARVSAGVFVAAGAELKRSSRTSALTIAAKAGENVRGLDNNTFVVSPLGADFASSDRKYAPGEAVAMIAGNTGTRLTDVAKAQIQKLHDAGFEFVVGSMPNHTDSDAVAFVKSIGGAATVYHWPRNGETLEQAKERLGVEAPEVSSALGAQVAQAALGLTLATATPLSTGDGLAPAQIEQSARDTVRVAMDRTHPYEGVRTKVYLDTKGNRTIGIGHNVESLGAEGDKKYVMGVLGVNTQQYARIISGLDKLSNEQVERLFLADMTRAVNRARSTIPNYEQLPQDLQAVLADLVFWGILPAKFPKMMKAVKEGRWEAAAKELLDSDGYRDTQDRPGSTRERYTSAADTMRKYSGELMPYPQPAAPEGPMAELEITSALAVSNADEIAVIARSMERAARLKERVGANKPPESMLSFSSSEGMSFKKFGDQWYMTDIDYGYYAEATLRTMPGYDEDLKGVPVSEEEVNALWLQDAEELGVGGDKDYASIAQAIEAWKKEEGIVYNPAEAWRRGEAFYHDIGAFNPGAPGLLGEIGRVLLAQSRLLRKGDTKWWEKTKDQLLVSGYTAPASKADNTRPGSGLRFVIRPTSNDLIWAAAHDVYSGTVRKDEHFGAPGEWARAPVTVEPKAPAAQNLQSIADSIEAAIQGRTKYNEIGVRLRLGNFYIEAPAEQKWIISVSDNFTGEVEQYVFDNEQEALDAQNPDTQQYTSKLTGPEKIPAELQRLNTLLKRAYQIANGSLDAIPNLSAPGPMAELEISSALAPQVAQVTLAPSETWGNVVARAAWAVARQKYQFIKEPIPDVKPGEPQYREVPTAEARSFMGQYNRMYKDRVEDLRALGTKEEQQLFLAQMRLPRELRDRLWRLVEAQPPTEPSENTYQVFEEDYRALRDAYAEDELRGDYFDAQTPATSETFSALASQAFVEQTRLRMIEITFGKSSATYMNILNKYLNEAEAYQQTATAAYNWYVMHYGLRNGKLPRLDKYGNTVRLFGMRKSKYVQLTPGEQELLRQYWYAIGVLLNAGDILPGGKVRPGSMITWGNNGLLNENGTPMLYNGSEIGAQEPAGRFFERFNAAKELQAKLKEAGHLRDTPFETPPKEKRGAFPDVPRRLNLTDIAGYFEPLFKKYYNAASEVLLTEERQTYMPQLYGTGYRSLFAQNRLDVLLRAVRSAPKTIAATDTLLSEELYTVPKEEEDVPAATDEQKKVHADLVRTYLQLIGQPIRTRKEGAREATDLDLKDGSNIIDANLQIKRRIMQIEQHLAMRDGYDPASSESKKRIWTAAKIDSTYRNYRFKEWSNRAHERRYKNYNDAFKNAGLAPLNANPFFLNRQYAQDVFSAVAHRSILHQYLMAKSPDGRPAVIARPVPKRPGEGGKQSVIPDKLLWDNAQALGDYFGVNLNRSASPEYNINWLIDKFVVNNKAWARVGSRFGSVKEFYAVPEAKWWLRHLTVEPTKAQWLGVSWADMLTRAVQWPKMSAVAWSAFFPISLLESVVMTTGVKRSILRRPIVATKEILALHDNLKNFRPPTIQVVEEMVRSGLKLSENVVVDEAKSFVDKDIERMAEWARVAHGPKAEKFIRGLFDLYLGRPTARFFFEGMFPAIKMWSAFDMASGVAQDSMGLQSGEDITALTPEQRKQVFDEIVNIINPSLGGENRRRFWWANNLVWQWVNWLMFAPNWTLSAAQQGGLATIYGRALGGQYSPADYHRLTGIWISAGLTLFVVMPNLIQAAIWAAAGGPDDEPFSMQNEENREGYIDITPIVRKMPWYKGDPTGKRRFYMRFGKQIYEVTNGWLREPGAQLLRKLSQPVKLLLEQLTGKSPGSDWNLEFAGQGWAGWLQTDEGAMYSRLGYALQKVLPMSSLQVFRDRETFLASLLAPTSKGMSSGRATQMLIETLNTYADRASWEKIRGNPKYRAALDAMVPGIIEAARKNGYDTDKIILSAKGAVLSRLYKNFFNALSDNNIQKAESLSRGIWRVGGTLQGLKASMTSRARNYGRELTPDETAFIEEAFNNP